MCSLCTRFDFCSVDQKTLSCSVIVTVVTIVTVLLPLLQYCYHCYSTVTIVTVLLPLLQYCYHCYSTVSYHGFGVMRMNKPVLNCKLGTLCISVHLESKVMYMSLSKLHATHRTHIAHYL